MTVAPDPLPGARLLFSIDPGVAYLNHGGFGGAPMPVQRAQQRLRDEMESNPHAFFVNAVHDRVENARRYLAAFLGADPESTALIANATAGANIMLNAISLDPGDNVVSTSHGYGAVGLAVERLCARTGAEHRVVALDLAATDDDIVSAVDASLTDRTRLLIVDHIASATARVLPVERLMSAARARGVPVAVDAAHAPGALPVDVDAIGADFWFGNLHKWLYAPRPTAILHVGSQWRDRVSSLIVSWDEGAGFPISLEMQGTLDYTAWLAAPTGLDVMRTLGVDTVRAYNAALVAYGQKVVAEALDIAPGASLPEPGHERASMRVIPLPDGIATTQEDAHALHYLIADELRTVVAVNSYRGRGLLRLSAQVYNHADEYDRLAAGLPRLLKTLR